MNTLVKRVFFFLKIEYNYFIMVKDSIDKRSPSKIRRKGSVWNDRRFI